MARRIALLSAAALVAAASGQDLCSCSPTSFEFTLDLSGTCDNNTVEDNPGISGSDCFIEALDDGSGQEVGDPGQVVEVFTVEFIEFDTTTGFTVINQDNKYEYTSRSDGGVISFYSKSSFLDTSLPLADQQSNPDLVPGSATLNIYGRTADDSIVKNTVAWSYDMNCGEENSPIVVGDQIGWLNVVSLSLEEASQRVHQTNLLLLTLFFPSSPSPRAGPATPGRRSATPSPRIPPPFPHARPPHRQHFPN